MALSRDPCGVKAALAVLREAYDLLSAVGAYVGGHMGILMTSASQDTSRFAQPLGDGACSGLDIQYVAEIQPEGVTQAFVIGAEFIGRNPCGLILGDSIFYGHDLAKSLQAKASYLQGAAAWACPVHDPGRYGVVEFGPGRRVLSIEGEPRGPKSCYAVARLDSYGNGVVGIAKLLTPRRVGSAGSRISISIIPQMVSWRSS